MKHVKQLIIVRNDLRSKLRHGKLAAQVAHASMAAFLQNKILFIGYDENGNVINPELKLRLSDAQYAWIDGVFTKVVLRADDLDHLQELSLLCRENNIPTFMINDAGRTVFSEPTITCMGVGPFDSEILDNLFSDLKMY